MTEEVEKAFQKLVEKGIIKVETALLDSEEIPKYALTWSTLDKEKAVIFAERFEMAEHFDRVKQLCFVDGMIDAFSKYREQILKLKEPLKNEKALKIGEGLIDWLTRERRKI